MPASSGQPLLTRLRALRLRAALTQRDLAERADVTETTVRRIERQQLQPRPTTVRKLARALGVAPSELMDPEDRA